nr:MAG TPA: baseplate wedge protein [Caudoviricetes sp.]
MLLLIQCNTLAPYSIHSHAQFRYLHQLCKQESGWHECVLLHYCTLLNGYEQVIHRWPYSSIGELPSHGHEISSANLTGQFQICSWCGGGNRSGIVSAQDIGQVRGPDGDGKQSMLLLTINASHNHTAGNTGGGSAHNVMQPYQTVYRWKRTG